MSEMKFNLDFDSEYCKVLFSIGGDNGEYHMDDKLTLYDNKIFIGDTHSFNEKYDISNGMLNDMIENLKNNVDFKIYFGESYNNGEYSIELNKDYIIFTYDYLDEFDKLNENPNFYVKNNNDNRMNIANEYQILLNYVNGMMKLRKLSFLVDSDNEETEIELDFMIPRLKTHEIENIQQLITFINNKDYDYHSLCFVNRLNGYFSIVATKDNYEFTINSPQQKETFTKKRNDASDSYMIKKLYFIQKTFIC